MLSKAIEFDSETKICGRLLWGHIKAQSCIFHRCIFYRDFMIEGKGNYLSHCMVLGDIHIHFPLPSEDAEET